MPLIPLKQSVIIRPGGNRDDWGNEIAPGQSRISPATFSNLEKSGVKYDGVDGILWTHVEDGRVIEYSIKCRADERMHVVKNQLGDEVVSSVQFLFDKLPHISYDDEIEYTNEIGVTVKRKPVNIEPIRMPSGKPVLTAVYV